MRNNATAACLCFLVFSVAVLISQASAFDEQDLKNLKETQSCDLCDLTGADLSEQI